MHHNRSPKALRRIHTLKVEAPVKMGQVPAGDFTGEKGLQVIACRTMQRAGESS
ncbi:MAG: hypothetical protein AB1427_19690 [Thermodesulfobacteriota bacterium]